MTMQTAITTEYMTDTFTAVYPAAPMTRPQAKTPSRLLKTLARKMDMIGVVAVMASFTVYAVSQVMTLGH